MHGYPKHVYIKLIKYANWILSLAALIFLGSILIAYPYAEHFHLPVQITAHILVMVLAGVIKVALVVRLVAQKGINESYAG